MGVLALDSKGDLSEPLHAIALHLGRESDVRQLEVRPDDALPDWQPRYAMNILADPSIPFSTYAKLLVDVATAAGQKGGQAFFQERRPSCHPERPCDTGGTESPRHHRQLLLSGDR